MDMLRSCYPSKMVLSLGAPPQAGQWYWCPAPVQYIPWPIAFGSRNWDDPKTLTYQLGEQGRPDGTWVQGTGGPSCTGGIQGPPSWWASGVPAAQYSGFCWTAAGGLSLRGGACFRAVWSVHGDYSWLCPPGVPSIVLEAWGGGGGGDVGPHFAFSWGPGHGAGGATYSRSTLAVTPGTVYPLHVGLGGQVANAPGEQSTFGAPALVSANPGPGTQAGGTTGGSIGTVRFNGGGGANPLGFGGGGGGASAGPAGRGQYVVFPSSNQGAAGGPDAGSGGQGGGSGSQDGHGPGGGGGGAPLSINFPGATGKGADGQIRISWPAGACGG